MKKTYYPSNKQPTSTNRSTNTTNTTNTRLTSNPETNRSTNTTNTRLTSNRERHTKNKRTTSGTGSNIYTSDQRKTTGNTSSTTSTYSSRQKQSSDYYKPIYPVTSTPVNPEIVISPKKQQEEYTAVIIDHGSRVLKAGVGGEIIPRYVCPSVFGRPRHPGLLPGMTKKDYYVGNEAQQKRDALNISWPIDCGLISNFEDATKTWLHVFKELEILPEDQPVIWTESSFVRAEQREKIAEILFETLGVPSINFSHQAVLAVYSAGLASALVVDLGDKCDVIPVYEGGALSHVNDSASKRLKITGSDITENLEQILVDRGYHFTTPAERDIVDWAKEQVCYVSEDPNKELTQDMTLLMPDSQQITIGNERWRAPEALFTPALIKKEGYGLHALIYHSIMDCGIDMRVEYAGNILLTGGTSMLPGLVPRIQRELEILSPSERWGISINAPPERKYAAWIGGSVLSTIDNFEKLCVTKELWDSLGKAIVHDSQF